MEQSTFLNCTSSVDANIVKKLTFRNISTLNPNSEPPQAKKKEVYMKNIFTVFYTLHIYTS